MNWREKDRDAEPDADTNGSKDVTVQLIWRRLNFKRDHNWVQPRLSDYVEGQLPARQRRRLERHEGLCPECRRAIRALKKLLQTLPGLRPATGRADVAERTARAVRERIEGEGRA
jgi:anti-sigma factor RsiW